MISRDVTLTISGREAKLDRPIYLYRGDGAIQFNVFIQEMQYKFGRMLTARNIVNNNIKYAELTVLKPDRQTSFTIPNAQRTDDTIQFVVSPQFINDLDEVGLHQFQIHLFDQQYRRVTLPPFEIEVLDVIAEPSPYVPSL